MSQHMDALGRANEVRCARAAVRRKLKKGELSLKAALANPHVQGMKAYDLLMAQWKWGPRRTKTALSRAEIFESRRVENLTTRQREALCNQNGDRP